MDTTTYIILGLLLLVNLTFVFMSLGILFGASFGAPFVPSGRRTVKKMLEIAQIKKGDYVVDLGCGDGRLVFASAEQGAKALGIEVSPPVYFLAKIRALLAHQKNAEIRFGNIFSKKHQKDIERCDIIFVFLLKPLMTKIFQKIWPRLKPGTLLVSHAFSPENKDILPEEIFPRTKEHGRIMVFKKK